MCLFSWSGEARQTENPEYRWRAGAVAEVLMNASVPTVEHTVLEQSLLGQNAAMRNVRAQVAKISLTPSSVLITGESGTGKEIVARAIHAASSRHAQAFVPINCGAIPEALLESQLFGHVRGAFTTAVQASPGLFAAADRGTIYLDEVGDLPLHMQVKLLRVIEEKSVWALGSAKPVQIDVRIIASTNRDLVKEIEAARFREDLFYRLNVVHIVLPPLRERRAGHAPLSQRPLGAR